MSNVILPQADIALIYSICDVFVTCYLVFTCRLMYSGVVNASAEIQYSALLSSLCGGVRTSSVAMSDSRLRDPVSGLSEPCFLVDEGRLTKECGQAVLDEILEVTVSRHLRTKLSTSVPRCSRDLHEFAWDE
jgi:hypothetical protein